MATWQQFEGLDGFKNEYEYSVAQSLLINELGYKSDGYQLDHAEIAESGWSFGGQQMDLSKGRGVELFQDIITHELGEDYISSNNLNTVLFTKGTYGLISNDIIEKINTALSSDYGKTKINAEFVSDVKNYIEYADKVEIELQKINPNIELSLGEKSMIIDFHNQYGLSLNNTAKNSMLKKLQDHIADHGDITLEDIAELYRTTEQYDKYQDHQEDRIQRTLDAAKEIDNGNSNSENDNTDITIPQITYDPESQTLTYTDTNGNQQQITYNEGNDLLIYGDPSNPDKITFTDPVTGEYQEWAPDERGEYTETTPVYETQTVVEPYTGENPNIDTTTTIEPENDTVTNQEFNEADQQFDDLDNEYDQYPDGGLGIEDEYKEDIDTKEMVKEMDYDGDGRVSVLEAKTAQTLAKIASSFISQSLDLSYLEGVTLDVVTRLVIEETKQGEMEFLNQDTIVNITAGAVASFATNYYFSKNDNVSDILNIEDRVIGRVIDSISTTYTTQMIMETVKTGSITNAIKNVNIGDIGVGLAVNFVLSEIGFESQNHAKLTNMGTVIGSIIPGVGTILGTVVGFVLGSFFKRKEPKAEVRYEYDEEIEAYVQTIYKSSHGGDAQALDKIAKTIVEQLGSLNETIGGVPLKNEDYMPQIDIDQEKDNIRINTTGGEVEDSIKKLLLDHLNGYEVEGGDIHIKRAVYHYEGDDLDELLQIYESSKLYELYTTSEETYQESIEALGFVNEQILPEAQIKLDEYIAQTDIIVNQLIINKEQQIQSLYIQNDDGDWIIPFYKHNEANELQEELEELQALLGTVLLHSDIQEIQTLNESYENLDEVQTLFMWKTTFENAHRYDLTTPVPTEEQTKVEYQAEEFNERLEYQIELDTQEIEEIQLWQSGDTLIVQIDTQRSTIPLDLIDEYTISVDGYAYSLEKVLAQAESTTVIRYGEDGEKERSINFEQSNSWQPLTLDTEYFTLENSEHEVYEEPIHLDEKTLTNLTLEQNGSEFDDTITGDSKDNEIRALGGDDTIYASLGDDLYDGGEGIDRVDYSNFESGITAEISQEEIILSHTIENKYAA